MPVVIRPLRFVHRDSIVEIADLDPNLTVLEYLRGAQPEGAGCTGTKEGCASGDCGACAVVIAELEATPLGEGNLRYRAINSCIRTLSSIEGCALWTSEDIAPDRGARALHPVQQALIDQHGSQCGFCTPGFVMSLYALYCQHGADAQANAARDKPAAVTVLSRDDILHALSGNLCRCTGYRPIVEAGVAACAQLTTEDAQASLAAQRQQTLRLLKSIAPTRGGRIVAGKAGTRLTSYRPRSLPELLALRAAHPDAQLIAGSTDVGLSLTKRHLRFAKTLDVSGVAELRQIKRDKQSLLIGAAARLTEAFEAIVAMRPQLAVFCDRFAGLTIRNSATLGGNIANGSPIGDSMPLLIALGAHVRLASAEAQRQLPIETFFVAFRRTALAANEVLTVIVVPKPAADEIARAYKVSKRFEDDISTVCLAIRVQLGEDDAQAAGGPGRTIRTVRIGAGGVAATPARAAATEAALLGRPWTLDTVSAAAEVLRNEFTPIDDLRGSAAYRRHVLGNLLIRFWHEAQGTTLTLDSLDAAQVVAMQP